jgi:hypothetical protein
MIAITFLFARLGGCFNSGRKLNPVLRHQRNFLQQAPIPPQCSICTGRKRALEAPNLRAQNRLDFCRTVRIAMRVGRWI